MSYTQQEKSAVLLRYQKGASISELRREFSISRSTIYRWCRAYSVVDPKSDQCFTIQDYRQLQRRVQKLENIVTVLKTVDCTVSDPLKERLDELEKLYGEYDVYTLCEALDVSRGTFYNHILRNKRDNAWFHKRKEEFRQLIQETFDEFDGVFGAEKIRAILIQRGHRVSKAYVTNLMNEMGLASVRSSAKQDYLQAQKAEGKRNILQQQFQVDKPNRVWVSDVTCFKFKEHYYYICVIIDLFSRKVIAHRVSKKNSTQLITRTFLSAWENRQPGEGLIFHSDRGNQYTANCFREMLEERKVRQSFSNTAKPHDNAVSESFFSSLKKEALYRKEYSSEAAFLKGIDEYMAFYNTQRPHKVTKFLSPCQFEERYLPM